MAKPRQCPTCGFPSDHDDLARLFSGKAREIYQAVAASGAAGIAMDRLIGKVYGADPNGGPLYARNCIAVQVRQRINPRLEPHGLKIAAGRGRRCSPYRLIQAGFPRLAWGELVNRF